MVKKYVPWNNQMRMLNRKMLKKKENSFLSPNNALLGRNYNLKSDRERKRGRELFLDEYLVIGYNYA